jgi:hypothetical protein
MEQGTTSNVAIPGEGNTREEVIHFWSDLVKQKVLCVN